MILLDRLSSHEAGKGMDEIVKVSLLYDFYGQLLTDKRQRVMQLYHEENLSLAEIAEEFGISRQGVHDALKNAESSLCEYEEKLGLVKRFAQTAKAIDKIDAGIDELIKENTGNAGLVDKLTNIKSIIDELE